jgi:hypothetical protein
VVSAHGIGGAADLPIPLSFVVAGAGVALAVSFAVLALAWRTPRFDDHPGGRVLPPAVSVAVDSPWLRGAVRLLGLVVAAYVGWAAFAGRDAPENPALGVFYIYLWVGLVPLSLLLGNVWPLLSPVRTVHVVVSRLLRTPPSQGTSKYPPRLGCWPAAVGLFAFVWTELVNPAAEHVSTVTTWVLLYAAVMMVGATVYGDRFLARADPFEAWFGLVARLSPWAREPDEQGRSRVVLRNPLANLARVTPEPGLVALVAVLLGSTAYDSFSRAVWWIQLTAGSDALHPVLRETAVLLGFVVLVGVTFTAAAVAGSGTSGGVRRGLPARLAHSLVPIGVGYVLAHYLTLLLESGQAYLIFLSDPLVTGQADLLGTRDWSISYFLSLRPTLLASLKVGFVLLGHVLAVVAAHDRALRLLPPAHAVRGQLAMLALMVFYTVGGLLLLFSV